MSDEQTVRPAGVMFAPPPPILYGQIAAAVKQYAEALPVGESGGVVAIATTRGVQGAIVQKFGDRNTIVGWIGKPSGWGAPLEGGLAWKLTW
jgi:hypothetical protein